MLGIQRGFNEPRQLGTPFTDSIAAGLVSFWPLDEGGGLFVRDSFGANVGTFTTTIAWNTNRFGTTPSLASSGFISVPNSARLNFFGTGTPLSISAWVYWVSSTEAYNSIFEKAQSTIGPGFFITSTSKLAFYLGNTGIDPGTASIPTNTWTQVAATYDGTNMTLYINGKQDKTSAPGSIAIGATSNALLFGKSVFGSGRFFNGRLANIGYWSRCLTASEIARLYVEPYAPFTVGKRSEIKRVLQPTVLGFTFPMFNSSGTPTTGLTVTARTSIDGAALAASANSVTELSNGWYAIDFTNADFSGTAVGMKFSATGANDTTYTVLRTGTFTTLTYPFAMFDSSGNPVTGATVTATRSKNGAAFASCANSASELSLGWYKILLAASDLNLCSTVSLRFAASGCVDSEYTIIVAP